ncbi:MAG: sulfotransferase, partial [Elusimicrobiota bacterium]
MLDLRRYWNDFEDVEINKPVFVLGFHGSGTSLLSRMIRRHKNFVSVSGNYKYWSGADEMQVVLGPTLSPEFTGIKHNLPADLKPPTGWIYASDKYIDYYRKTKEDVTPELRRSFRKIIRWQIVRHATNKDKARFTDKSQVFTVKVSFINEILKDAKPKFILLVRNPYAMCYRRAKDNTGSLKNNNIGSYKKRLKVVCEHTRNSIKYAFKDSDEADLKVIRFEDVLNEPDQTLKEICNFIKVGFSERMIPQSEDKVCFGSTGKDKWYPLRPDVNEK